MMRFLNGEKKTSEEQAGCQCTRPDCYCSKATQCVNNPDASTNTHTACTCKTPTKTACCRGMPCVCANKSQDQAYYTKRIDEEISEWLKDVPVHSVESSDSKKKRETVIKDLRKTLRQLPDDENFDEYARNEIKSFVYDFPLWNPGKDKKDEKLFKHQLADKLTQRILSVPRKPDRFRDIVKKWVGNMDFEDNGDDVDKETIIDKFVNKLKSIAVDRPACDIKYTNTLRKEIIELLVELALKFDGDMVMLKKMANKLATEIVGIPRNVNLSGDTTDLTDEFDEIVSDWICEHGLCGELKKDPKLVEGLAKKLNKLKCQGIDDECVVEKMKEEIHTFVDDVGIAIETMDELIDELIKQLSNTVQTNEMERLDRDEFSEVCTDWLSILPGVSDLHPRKLEKIIKELVNLTIEGREQGNKNLANDILNYLVDADYGFSIDPADLGIHVEELMEKLNLLPSNKYNKEQVKKALLKDIFDVIEDMSISEGKKEKLRIEAHKIVVNHLLRSSLQSKESHDDVKEAILEDIDDAISVIDIPKESRLKLKASLSCMLNSNFDKSLTRLRRPSKDGSNLKHTIAKDVRKAVKELPIDTDKKRDLMQQVKGTLSKNMHKPLPSNIKNTINDEISDIVERCPIFEDNSIVGSLKKMLSAVASKHLNICLPKCVCDIQNKVEKDLGIVIDRSSIDTGKKKELKKSIQDILADNEDRHISDDVLKTIKQDINGVVSDLSIPQDTKDILKKTVGETMSKDFNEASSNLRHDLNKVRDKLFEDICNIIEKSPTPRDVKKHLINKLKSVLAKNLDSSLSDEEKYKILDDVSNIVKDDMPEEKRRSLTNKLAKMLNTQQKKEDTNEIEIAKNLNEFENKILEHIFRDLEQAVEDAPIPRKKKIEFKKELKDMARTDYKKTAKDITKALTYGINLILDELNLTKDKKNKLKSELAAAIDENSKLLREIEDVGTEYLQTNRGSSAVSNVKHKTNGKDLMHTEGFDENEGKESILQGIKDIIEKSAIPEDKKVELKGILKKLAAGYLKKPVSDDFLDYIKIVIKDILDDLQIPKSEKDKLKRAVINKIDEYIEKLRNADKANAKESFSQGIEKIIEESNIPEEKQKELKRKLEKIATNYLKQPLSDDMQDAMRIDIADIIDDLQIPKSEKDKLKRALVNKTEEHLAKMRDADETKARESISQGIEKIIEESNIPEVKKRELKRKLAKMATDNLELPLSDNVQDAMRIDIADILDDLQIPKPEKDKLKRALINKIDEYIEKLRNADKAKAKGSFSQGIEKIIEESNIPEEKKRELKRKLEKIATNYLKQPLSDDMQDAMRIDIADIIDDLQIPKSEKDKLKRALVNKTEEHLAKMRDADETKARESISQGIEKIIEESNIPEVKKRELKRKLAKMATDNLELPLSDNVQDAMRIDIADILDDLQIPKPEKDKLKRALINKIDEYIEKLRNADKAKAKESFSQGIENIIEESNIPEEKQRELKRKLEKIATDYLKQPLSDDMQDAMRIDIADIIDDLQIPKSEKDKLKRALVNKTEEHLAKMRDADETKARESISQGIEKIIEESNIPEVKKRELKRKLAKMATDNLELPLSDNVQDAMRIDIADILDDLQIPKPEKDKLKRALINKIDEYIEKLRNADKAKAKGSFSQGIEKNIEESNIPEEKKRELKRKLEKIATNYLKQPLSDDMQDAMRIDIADIIDDLQIPKSEKDKLKRALVNKTEEHLAKMRDADETKARESISHGIEKIIEESNIPEEKKRELKEKLAKMATDNLELPLSDDVQDAMRIDIADILDDLQIPKSEKDKLKRALINKIDEYIDKLRNADKAKAKESFSQGIENIIEESNIPEEKQRELKRKLEKIATDYLKQPLSDDMQDAMRIDIADIIDDLQIPKSEKDKLKRALVNKTEEHLAKMRDADETKARESISQGIEKIIEESNIPEVKKRELKRKLAKMATDNLELPLSDNVQDAMRIDIADILDDLQIPKPEKDKLKRALINKIDEYIEKLRNADKAKAKESFSQGIEKIIEESNIPEEKKRELKRKLEKIATNYLKQPLSDDMQDAMRIDIADIIDDLQIPKSEKDKLKRALVNKTEEHLAKMRDADETKARESISQGIEKIIEESNIPEVKKRELKRKLAKMATDNLELPLSDNVQDAMRIDIADILDDLQIPKPEKDKLKRALINKIDEYIEKLRNADKAKAKGSFSQGIEKIIEESNIPEEKKRELKRKLEKIATDYLKQPLSDDMQDAMRIDIADIIDDLQIPKSEKDKLKRALVNKTEEHLAKMRDADETKARESISQGIEKIIEESNIPEVKKRELKRKLAKMATDNLELPLSDNVQDAMRIDIADILDDLQIPKPEKDKLKRALINKIDEYIEKLRNADKAKAKESFSQGIEKIIEESNIPEEKKRELKRKLEKIATNYLKQPLSDDMQDAMRIDIADIIDDLQIPKSEKDKLKRALVNKTEEHLAKMRDADETKARESISQGIEKIIEESNIPEVKKRELKRKLAKMATDNLELPLSDNVQDAMRIDIADILDDLQIPKPEKDKLKRALINKIDEYIEKLRNADKAKAKESFSQGIEKIIEESNIPEEKKRELKRKLEKIATNYLKQPLSDDMQDAMRIDIADIIDDLQITKSEKDKLKRALVNKTEEHLAKMRDADEPKARESISHGIEKIIEESNIPEEKKRELKRKWEKIFTDNLKKPLSDDMQDAIRIEIGDILDELQIPKSEKDKLKRALINKTDENIAKLRDADKTKARESISQGIEKIIQESNIPEVKKRELKRKMEKMATDNLELPLSDDMQDAMRNDIADILDDLQITESEKDKLKGALINKTDENIAKLRAADKTKATESIWQGIEKIIDESNIPEEKKRELKRKLKKMVTDHLKQPLSDNMQDAMRIDVADILDDLQIPKSEKDKLQRALINKTDKNIAKLRAADKTKARESISQGIENIIEESNIPEEKKRELKRKLEKIFTENLKKPLSDDMQDAMRIDIADILDDLQIPKSEKDKLKGALINKTDENIAKLRDADKTKTRESIFQGIENIIEKSNIPEEKKRELKRKLKKIFTDNLKQPLSDNMQDALRIDIADVLDGLRIPKSEKDKLKRALINKTDENLASLRDADKPKAKQSFSQGIEKIIEESNISEEKKRELKRKLEKIFTDNLKKPLSDDMQDAMRIDIGDILNDSQIPKSEKDKLKRALINKTDENIAKLRDANKTKAKKSISKGIENIIEESNIPEEKKRELKRKLEKMFAENLELPLSDDMQDALRIDIADILNDLQIPKSDKDKLKRALINKTDENIAQLRDSDKTEARESIAQGIEKIIEESNIPEEEKWELKSKLEKMATDILKQPLSNDVQDAMRIDIADIMDDLQIPKSEKNKLKRALINKTDENIAKLRDANKTKARESISQGIEKIIEESNIPEEKKRELKRKLEKIFTNNLKKPLSDVMQDAMRNDIGDILDELQIPKSDKDKLKRALINKTDENIAKLRDANKTKARESISQGIEKIIEESNIPEEKKRELKRKLEKMATDNLELPLSDDVQGAMRNDIADILDELQIPKSEKDKLKRALINKTDENIAKLRDADKTKARESISEGIEKIIEESNIPEEKKETRSQVSQTKRNLVDDIETKFRDTKKYKLSKGLMPIEEVDETNAKESILHGIENIVEESAIPEEKKMELKRKLNKIAVDNLKKPFSNDVQETMTIGITDVLDELQIPKSEKIKLKRALVNLFDEYVDSLQETKQGRPLKGQRPKKEEIETKQRENMLLGIDNIIEESVIPEEKKMELNRKLKKVTTDNFKKPQLTDNVQDAIKNGIADILDELQIPNSDQNNLKRALFNMVDENMDNLQETKQGRPLKGQMHEKEVDETKERERILLGIDNIIEGSVIPEEKKMELNRKLKKVTADNFKKPQLTDNVQDAIKIDIADILDELQIPTSEKNHLKRALFNMVDENVDNLQDTKQGRPLKGQRPEKEVDETKERERILLGIDNIIEGSVIPEEKKMELNRKLKKVTADNFKKPQLTDNVQDAIKISIADILDELQIPNAERNNLKRALFNMVDENVDNSRGGPLKFSSQADDFKKSESVTQNNLLLGFEKAIDEAPIPIDKKKELKKKLNDMATKNFQKSLSDDTVEPLKAGINEILDELNLPKDKKKKLKSELFAAVDENFSNIKNETNIVKPMPETKKNKLNDLIRTVLPQFDEAIDPSYQKHLSEEFDELVEKAHTREDFKDLRRKLINISMSEHNLSEKEASKLVDELIGGAPEIALKENMRDERYELDPSYVKTLEEDINDLVSVPLVGGDFEDAKRKLIKRLMREQKLPEEQASVYADDLIGKAKKLTPAAQSKDKSLLHEKAFAKAISDAIDRSTMSQPDKSSLKNSLLSNLKQTMDKQPFMNIDDLEPLKSEVLKHLKKNVDASSLPTDKKNELKSLLNKELAKTIDEIMDTYDNEEGYTKDYTKAISKAVNKTPIPNLKKSSLKKALAKTFDEIMDDNDEDKIRKHKEAFSKAEDAVDQSTLFKPSERSPEDENKLKKYKEAFARAISDAVDQSTLSKPDKSSQRNKLLSKLHQTIDNSSHLNDIGALIADVLKDSEKVVDVSSIPTDKKSELKLLLQEGMEEASKKLMDDDENLREVSTLSKDKISETVKTWMDSLPVELDPKVATAVAKDIASDILDRQKYLQVHPEAVSTDKDEIENLKYQIFRRMKNLVDPKALPPIVDRTGELYRMIMDMKPPLDFLKLRRSSLRGLVDHN